MDRSRVAFVIPAFNESSTIFDVIAAASAFGQSIVVNDHSLDDTATIAEAAGALVVNHTINQGYDNALNSGFKAAASLGVDYIVTLDADGQHDPALLPRLIAELENGASLVLGVRSSKARFAEHVFGLYTRLRYGVLDPLCGLKGYRRDLYESIGHFDSYKSIGTELMLRAVASGVGYKQVRFQVRDRADAPRFGRSLVANAKILRALIIWILS
ncbi:glycosyltransferase involved in cell wall biosynthesis [Hydrogenophaga palleronii]|uniref:Glycosyltransferase involved in cell wall biosynthesis n=1 Tax=Hydrogenophaga palleronii TaxID=65655 RepID=A0ABU1WSQ3_9BURK|nr:glycosyltransferase family 2 protein [Hydrogenophaga palleronii]MDR7152333.1 glycosyltransferase involved in cell wall biosynthesis [Hydrogenophaga palleronii]